MKIPRSWTHMLPTGLVALVAPACAGSPKTPSVGRLCHIGLVWLEEPGNEAHRERLIEAAHTLLREIPEVRRLSAGVGLASESQLVDSSYDVCFVMEFDDRAAMDRYARHPAHEKAAREVFLPLARKVLFYDFVGR